MPMCTRNDVDFDADTTYKHKCLMLSKQTLPQVLDNLTHLLLWENFCPFVAFFPLGCFASKTQSEEKMVDVWEC